MSRIQPLFSVLRPLAASRRNPSQQFSRFSTATRLRAEQPASTLPRKLPKASKNPKTSPDAPSTPQEVSRAADLAAAEAVTDADSAQPPAPKPVLPSKQSDTPKSKPADDTTPPTSPAAQSPADTTSRLENLEAKPLKTAPKSNKASKTRAANGATIELPPPKYHVARSTNKNLPIYTDYKRGGNLHLTTIRKVTGDLSALRDEIRIVLNKKNEDVKINSLTQHVIVKGHHVPEITEFLRTRGM